MSPSLELRENRELARELKFLVPLELGPKIRAWAREQLRPDPHAGGNDADQYQITSIYFDTPQFDVYHRRGSYGRSKFRIRRYGDAPVAFAERKLKTNGMVSKRRSPVSLTELCLFGDGTPTRSAILNWYHKRLLVRKLEPKCVITYSRTARVGDGPNGAIRLTVDEKICAAENPQITFPADFEGKKISPEHLIVELKYRCDLPAIFKMMVEQFALSPAAMSKYRLAAAELKIVPVNGANVQAPAAVAYA